MHAPKQLKRSMAFFIMGCFLLVVPALTGAGQAEELPQWLDRIVISGLIEVEAGFENVSTATEDSGESSDLALATVELGIEAAITDHVSGSILFLYEDGEDIIVNEGFLTLSGGDAAPVNLTGGEFYVPFGNFESHMISDPLTLEIGETRETALSVGTGVGGLYGAAYLFNGDVDAADEEDDHINNFGAHAGYVLESDALSLDIGIGYINNLIDADGWEGILEEENLALSSYAGGVGAHAIATMGAFTCIAEVITALDDIEWIDEAGQMVPEDAILAWNTEIGLTVPLGGSEGTFAVAYQGTENAYDRLPETRYMGSFGFDLMEGAGLSFEYLYDEFEGGDEADVVTAQLAIEF